MLQKQKSFHFFSLFLFFSFFSLSLSQTQKPPPCWHSNPPPTPSIRSPLVASSDPCSGTWFGVACYPATRRVTRIVLENLNLIGSAYQLTQLAHLKLLSLNRNRLSSSLDFSAWHNLNHMYLSHNRFEPFQPESPANATSGASTYRTTNSPAKSHWPSSLSCLTC
ncbi:hypothetical protein PS2_042581 [Malus domestica]